jgi:hypothetical protein
MDEWRYDRVCRAPNGKFYVTWRRQPVCGLGDVLLYFDTELKGREYLIECDAEAAASV